MSAQNGFYKEQFDAVIEGAFEGFSWWDLTYKAMHLAVPKPAVMLYENTNSYILYGRARDFKNITRAELPKGQRENIGPLNSLDGMTIYYQECEKAPGVIEKPRLIILRDGRIFLGKPPYNKSGRESPIYGYEDTIEDSLDTAREIFSNKEYAQAWDSL